MRSTPMQSSPTNGRQQQNTHCRQRAGRLVAAQRLLCAAVLEDAFDDIRGAAAAHAGSVHLAAAEMAPEGPTGGGVEEAAVLVTLSKGCPSALRRSGFARLPFRNEDGLPRITDSAKQPLGRNQTSRALPAVRVLLLPAVGGAALHRRAAHAWPRKRICGSR